MGPLWSWTAWAGAARGPIIEVARRIVEVEPGQVVRVLADDPAAGPDLAAWCRMRNHTLVSRTASRFEVRRDH